jgi:hypothetical protein
MNPASPAYGLWTLVILNSAVFILLAFSFSKPNTARHWRSFGAFAAFIVALFVELRERLGAAVRRLGRTYFTSFRAYIAPDFAS